MASWTTGVLWFAVGCASGGVHEPAEAGDGTGAPSGSDGETEGGPDPDTPGDPAVADVSYYADVKPLVDARCGSCHAPGGVGPFGLTTYDEVAAVGELVAAVTEARTMPPWPADPGCNTYQHDPTLSEDQVAVLRAWVEAGKPPGDPAQEGAPLVQPEVVLDRVDLHIGMAEAHTPSPTDGIDEHRCFLVDWPEQDVSYITGFEAIPGNRAALHHFVGIIVPPSRVADLEATDDLEPGYGWDCGAGTGMAGGLGGKLFATWVPGSRAHAFPAGTGLRVEPGSKILLNMHYNVLAGDTSPDQTMFDFQLEKEVEREGHAFFATDIEWPVERSMDIPAGEPSVIHSSPVSQAQFGAQPYTIHALGMHMHTLGTRARLFIERASGEQECALDIPRWDFDWQLGYDLAEPIHVGEGDALHIECEWDNSAGNQPLLDGEFREPVDVNWGEDTYDEMCLGMVYVTLD